ncbi:MAG TPA: hypothetical protein VFT01_03680, partial [Homoserinimonas sp.]|nr:hypothetical protein [Homoserinimonas sp.]
MTIQPQTLITIGIVLLALVTVESGGYFLTKVMRGHVPTNALQKNFYRAGHAHAAVLLILGMVILLVVDQVSLDQLGPDGIWGFAARNLVLISAILMPAGFFLSVVGTDPQKPNRLIILLWLGAMALTIGLLAAGTGILVAG